MMTVANTAAYPVDRSAFDELRFGRDVGDRELMQRPALILLVYAR